MSNNFSQNLFHIKKMLGRLLFISVIIESILFFSQENLFASISLCLGWFAINKLVLTTKNLILYPVSFIMVLGLGIFHYILPLLLTLLELKPVTFNMNVPYVTFTHHLLFAIVISITHFVYTHTNGTSNIFRSILIKTDFYNVPSNKLIWTTAILSLISSSYLIFIYGQWQTDVADRSFLFYLATKVSPFLWMPLVIPFSKFRNIDKAHNHFNKKHIIIYALIVCVICIASNVRTLLFTGVMIFGFLFLLGLVLNFYKIREFISVKSMIGSCILLIIISGPLTDLGYAMVAVRQQKYELSTGDFLKKTLEIFQNKDLLDKIKSLDVGSSIKQPYLIKNWDEQYLSNQLFNRFSNLKISDNCLYYAERIGYGNIKMKEEFINQILAVTPNALLDVVGIDYSKKLSTSSYSMTDYLYSLAIGDSTPLGSFIIGAMPGVGMAIFSYWYLLIIIPIYMVIFSTFDSFVMRKDGKVVFSYLFFIMLISVVNYFNDRHVYQFEFRWILRTYIELILSYLIIIKIVKFISNALIKKRI